MENFCITTAQNDIASESKGFFVIRGLYSEEEITSYRNECDAFFKKGRRVYARIIRDDIPDYIHPRSVFEDGTVGVAGDVQSTYRIYQYFHNHHSEGTQSFFEKSLKVRDQIESLWDNDADYLKEKSSLVNYIIVTKYMSDSNGLPKHIDYRGSTKLPLVQSVVVLSDSGVDYEGGDLIIYSRNNTTYSLQKDLKVKKGDVVFFDKSLVHEVLPTLKNGNSGIGRWSVLIGARSKRRGKKLDLYKYSENYLVFKRKIKKLFGI